MSYNLSGVDKLQLSPDTLAKIFQAQITTWNDPAIAADNPGATLPSTADRRSCTARTARARPPTSPSTSRPRRPPTWTLDAGDTVNWPTSTQAGNGNAGVAQIITATDGAIGYVDLSDATASKLTFASIKNKDGKFVAPTLDGATAAAGQRQGQAPTSPTTPLNASGADAYPITAADLHPRLPEADRRRRSATPLKGWINYVLTDGQALAADVDFAPLPSSLQQKAIAQLGQITIG